MEKTINLIMKNDKSLYIYVNDEEKCVIPNTNRSITAEKIYDIINFTKGDHYAVTDKCDDRNDKQVVEFFANLFRDITGKINQLNNPNAVADVVDNSDDIDFDDIPF